MAKLLESTQASAEAVAKVAQALEKRFGEEKKEKFSEASRVIRQPDLFHHPKSYEEEITMWPDWRLSFRSWLIYACEDFKGDLDKAESATGPMEFPGAAQPSREVTFNLGWTVEGTTSQAVAFSGRWKWIGGLA